MAETLRNLTPLALLGLCLLVWLERCVPGSSAIADNLGETAVLRLVVGLLCLFVLILMVERQQIHSLLQQLMLRLQQAQAGAGDQAKPGDAKTKVEAMSILAAALEADDPKVRQSAVHNLERLSGEKFGADVARWRQYIEALESE